MARKPESKPKRTSSARAPVSRKKSAPAKPSLRLTARTELDLQPPTFEALRTRFETTGVYTNPRTQQTFTLNVNGPDDTSVQQFISSLRLDCEALHRDASSGDDESAGGAPEQDTTVALDPKGIVVKLALVDAHGVLPPHVVRFDVDPLISVITNQSWQLAGTRIKVRVTVNAGHFVTASMGRQQERINATNSPKTSNPFRVGSSSSEQCRLFTLSLVGNGTYTLTGDYDAC